MSLRSEIKIKEKVAILGAVISFILFSLVLYLSKFSVGSIVGIQNHVIKTILLQSGNTNTFGAIYMFLNPFAYIFLSIIFLVLGFAFLSSYGYYNTNKKIGLICGIIGAVFTITFLNFSIISIFLAASIIIGCVYVIPLSNTYAKELKKWVLFRTGSHSISKILCIANILVVIGIFLAILLNLSFYENSFKSDITETMTNVAMSSIPETQVMLYDAAAKNTLEQELKKQIENTINDSPIFNAYINWLPATSAFSIWVLLEFLRGLVFSNIGGLFSSGILRILRKK
jgi:hypothetical protein